MRERLNDNVKQPPPPLLLPPPIEVSPTTHARTHALSFSLLTGTETEEGKEKREKRVPSIQSAPPIESPIETITILLLPERNHEPPTYTHTHKKKKMVNRILFWAGFGKSMKNIPVFYQANRIPLYSYNPQSPISKSQYPVQILNPQLRLELADLPDCLPGEKNCCRFSAS